MSLTRSRTRTFASILLSSALMMSCGIVHLPNDAWKQQPINTLSEADKAKAWSSFRTRAVQLANHLYNHSCMSNGELATWQTTPVFKSTREETRASIGGTN